MLGPGLHLIDSFLLGRPALGRGVPPRPFSPASADAAGADAALARGGWEATSGLAFLQTHCGSGQVESVTAIFACYPWAKLNLAVASHQQSVYLSFRYTPTWALLHPRAPLSFAGFYKDLGEETDPELAFTSSRLGELPPVPLFRSLSFLFCEAGTIRNLAPCCEACEAPWALSAGKGQGGEGLLRGEQVPASTQTLG